MDYFWVVTVFHLQLPPEAVAGLEARALEDHDALGIEEFSLDEASVDEILGERSYSGGDLPLEVLEEVEQTLAGRPQSFRFFFNSGESAEAFQKTVATEFLCETQLEKCLQEDWNAEWKKHYSPIRVNERLEILPAWHKGEAARSEKQIFIHPGMGFGTGSHETTFLCLKLFTEKVLDKKLNDVLDFGSGSGILGLAALLFFPNARVDFYDIDPEANKNCYQNAELNDLSERAFRLLLPEFRDRLLPSYELVFANILENILLAEKDALIAAVKPQGHLILSGLLRHQLQGIVDAYSSTALKLVAREEKGDWGALLFRKES